MNNRKIKIGDIVKGVGCKYAKTNSYMTKGEVVDISETKGYIKIKVLEHRNDDSCVGEIFGGLEEEYFELVETVNIEEENNNDNVNHPKHYTNHPSGIECIEITKHYDFSVGNAIKYLWRAGLKKETGMKDNVKEIEDLQKAIWYINTKINMLKEGE